MTSGSNYILKKDEIDKIFSFFSKKGVSSFKKIKDGIINDSYFIMDKDNNKYVLRIYISGKVTKNIDFEIDTMNFLTKKSIPIPLLHKTLKEQKYYLGLNLKNKKRFIVLMDFVEGYHLKSSDLKMINEVATIQSKMHLLLKKSKSKKAGQLGINSVFKWAGSEFNQAIKKPGIDINVKNQILNIAQELFIQKKSILKNALAPIGYVHYDYDSNNIIIKNNKVKGIIDFDDLTESLFVVDLGFSLWWWMYFNQDKIHEILKKYLSAYQKVRKLSKQEQGLLIFFIRMRNLILMCLLFVNISLKVEKQKIKKCIALDNLLKETKTQHLF